MPADAIAGIAEGIAALIELAIEIVLLVVELVVEVVFGIGELIAFLFFKRRERYPRPAWIEDRRERKSSALAKPLVVGIVALGLAGFHFGRTEIHFQHNGMLLPDHVEVVLSKGDRTKTASIEKGKLTLLRGRWDRLEIRDSSYTPATHEISGHQMHIWLERVPSLRHAVADAVIAEGLNRLRRTLVEGDEKKREAEQK
jgi:hypothetical protein